jgi:hypothetical protein
MKKLFATAALALALAACSDSGQAPSEPTVEAPKSGPSVPHITTEQRAAQIEKARTTMPAAINIDPQTDKAIDLMLGDHAAYHKAMTDFQKAVAAKDVESVAAMVRYPMTLDIDGSKVVIESRSRFKQYYGRIITPESAKVIVGSQYSDVMISGKGVLLGDGQTFMAGDCAGSDCKKVDVKIASFRPAPAAH